MDLRKFGFKKIKLNNSQEGQMNLDVADDDGEMQADVITRSSSSQVQQTFETFSAQNKFDIGKYLKEKPPNDQCKFEVLNSVWKPTESYDFIQDSLKAGRRFIYAWLSKYSPWLAYSQISKGPLCVYCVLFPPKLDRGVQGSFIVKVCDNYKKFHEYAAAHVSSSWHKNSTKDATNFLKVMKGEKLSVDLQINTHAAELIRENRMKLKSILSAIIFCGTHDIALRGKMSDTGNFIDLINFRANAGDTILQDHLKTCAKNAKYTSPDVQNQLVEICEDVLRRQIVSEVNKIGYWSILADESADISGKEQLSLAIRYFDIDSKIVKEEFLGFVEIIDQTADGIADVILAYCQDLGLEMNNLVGQGYDGCSTMAGRENGVQKKILSAHPLALFMHCASHRINLVANDLNKLPTIRNTVGTVKSIIKFFRESPTRRSLVPNIPLLCETRWTEKYKSIRLFEKNFITIAEKLENLAENGKNPQTQQNANQLLRTCNTPQFIVSLTIMAQYSAMLEPVVAALQAVNLDFEKCQKQIENLITIFNSHRENAETEFTFIYKKVKNTCNTLDIDLKIPRTACRQTYRNNFQASNEEEYFRRSIFIPYLDSLITSLKGRFSSSDNSGIPIISAAFKIHPKDEAFNSKTKSDFLEAVKVIREMYSIENIDSDAASWYDYWTITPPIPCEQVKELTFVDLLEYTEFYPAIRKIIHIVMTLPITTCTVERSFSTLRRIKTWLRSTMAENRLSGLAMMSVHRKRIETDATFTDSVIDEFGQNTRRLQLLFTDERLIKM